MTEARNDVVHRVTTGDGMQRRTTTSEAGDPHACGSSACSGVEPHCREAPTRPWAKHGKSSIAATALTLAALALCAAPADAACEKKRRISHSEAGCLTASWTHSGGAPMRMFRVRNRCPDLGKVMAKIDLAGARDRTWHLGDGDWRHGSTTHRIRDISCCTNLSTTCNRSDVFSESGCVARFNRRSPAAWSCHDETATGSAAGETRRCTVTATCGRAWRPGGGERPAHEPQRAMGRVRQCQQLRRTPDVGSVRGAPCDPGRALGRGHTDA